MNCYCLVASVLMGSSIATGLLVNYTHFHNFENSLNEEQKEKYSIIRKERLYIYLFATCLGLIVGFLNKSNKCIAVSGALFTQLFVYKLWPKSDYMLNHVTKPEQSALWLKQYKHMTNLSHIGMVIGLLVFFYTINRMKN